MASITRVPASVTTDDSVFGNYAWVNPGNATADNSSYATADGGDSTIANGGVVSGISLVVAGDYSGGLTPGNAGADTLPTTEATETFGGATDKWFWTPTLAAVQSSDFGAVYSVFAVGGNGQSAALVCTGFDFSAIPAGATINGFAFAVKKKRIGGVAHVNYVTLTVHYTEAATGNRRRRVIITSGGR